MAKEVQTRDVLSDLGAHSQAMSLPIAEVVAQLVDLLGATNVAVIGCVRETRAVQQWMSGREPQRSHALRFAYQIGTMIAASSDRELARAWFHGSNPYLDDAIPLLLLRDMPLPEIQGKLVSAARAFASQSKKL
jgi:hypothetical protein